MYICVTVCGCMWGVCVCGGGGGGGEDRNWSIEGTLLVFGTLLDKLTLRQIFISKNFIRIGYLL